MRGDCLSYLAIMALFDPFPARKPGNGVVSFKVKEMKKTPAWFVYNQQMLWVLLFVVCFVLAVDVWNWSYAQPRIFGLPFWIVYHLLLTISLSFIFFVFVRTHWRFEDD